MREGVKIGDCRGKRAEVAGGRLKSPNCQKLPKNAKNCQNLPGLGQWSFSSDFSAFL